MELFFDVEDRVFYKHHRPLARGKTAICEENGGGKKKEEKRAREWVVLGSRWLPASSLLFVRRTVSGSQKKGKKTVRQAVERPHLNPNQRFVPQENEVRLDCENRRKGREKGRGKKGRRFHRGCKSSKLGIVPMAPFPYIEYWVSG